MKMNNQINKLEYCKQSLISPLHPSNAFVPCTLSNVLLTQFRETLNVVDLF